MILARANYKSLLVVKIKPKVRIKLLSYIHAKIIIIPCFLTFCTTERLIPTSIMGKTYGAGHKLHSLNLRTRAIYTV